MTECRNNLAQDIAQDIEGQQVFELERQLEFLNPQSITSRYSYVGIWKECIYGISKLKTINKGIT